LYTERYQRFAPLFELKSTPLDDFIELNRHKTLLWGFDRNGPCQGQLLRRGEHCLMLQNWLSGLASNVIDGVVYDLTGEVFRAGAEW